jgi:hypothetical protein
MLVAPLEVTFRGSPTQIAETLREMFAVDTPPAQPTNGTASSRQGVAHPRP